MSADLFIERGADISPCGKYRTLLWRQWDKRLPALAGIFLNPSIADAMIDDMTMTIFMERARRLGCGGTRVGNLFTYRATDPKRMMAAEDPVGPDADNALCRLAQGRPMIIAGWGDGGLYRGRSREVVQLLCYDLGLTLHCLGTTKAGQPRHPLRIPYSYEPVTWKEK